MSVALARVARWSATRRRLVAAAWLLAVLAAAPFAAQLSMGGWSVPGSASVAVARGVAERFPEVPAGQIAAVVDHRDGHAPRAAGGARPDARRARSRGAGAAGRLGAGFQERTRHDLLAGELIGLPAAAMLLLVLGSLAAAALPVTVAVTALTCSGAIVLAASRLADVTVFTTNLASMLGLRTAVKTPFHAKRPRGRTTALREEREGVVKRRARRRCRYRLSCSDEITDRRDLVRPSCGCERAVPAACRRPRPTVASPTLASGVRRSARRSGLSRFGVFTSEGAPR